MVKVVVFENVGRIRCFRGRAKWFGIESPTREDGVGPKSRYIRPLWGALEGCPPAMTSDVSSIFVALHQAT